MSFWDSFVALFYQPEPHRCGPTDQDVEAERVKWREEVHKGRDIKTKQIAAAHWGEKAARELYGKSSEAMRTAERAIQLLEQSKKDNE